MLLSSFEPLWFNHNQSLLPSITITSSPYFALNHQVPNIQSSNLTHVAVQARADEAEATTQHLRLQLQSARVSPLLTGSDGFSPRSACMHSVELLATPEAFPVAVSHCSCHCRRYSFRVALQLSAVCVIAFVLTDLCDIE